MADKLQECLEKNSKHNVAETRTDSSGEGSVGWERCILAIIPTGFESLKFDLSSV